MNTLFKLASIVSIDSAFSSAVLVNALNALTTPTNTLAIANIGCADNIVFNAVNAPPNVVILPVATPALVAKEAIAVTNLTLNVFPRLTIKAPTIITIALVLVNHDTKLANPPIRFFVKVEFTNTFTICKLASFNWLILAVVESKYFSYSEFTLPVA